MIKNGNYHFAMAHRCRITCAKAVANDAVIAYEKARGWQAESVESENRGCDLISRRAHPEDLQTAVEVLFMVVPFCKGWIK